MEDSSQKPFSQKGKNKPSKKAKASSARLFAVQGVYQMLANQQSYNEVLEDILYKRVYEKVDDHLLVMPDGNLLKSIIKGVSDRLNDLNRLVLGYYNQDVGNNDHVTGEEKPEGLLFSVLLCGAYELMAHHDIDSPVIISDYINVGHAFFDRGETRLINGLLDKIATEIR